MSRPEKLPSDAPFNIRVHVYCLGYVFVTRVLSQAENRKKICPCQWLLLTCNVLYVFFTRVCTLNVHTQNVLPRLPPLKRICTIVEPVVVIGGYECLLYIYINMYKYIYFEPFRVFLTLVPRSFSTVRHRAPVCLRASAFRGPGGTTAAAHVELSHTHRTGVSVSAVHHAARGLAPGQRPSVAAEFHHPFPVPIGQHFRFFGKYNALQYLNTHTHTYVTKHVLF